jgi:hypothetical protein
MHRRHIAYGYGSVFLRGSAGVDLIFYTSNCTPACIVFDPSGTNDWTNLSQIDRSQTFIGKAKQRLTRVQLQPRYYLSGFGLSRQYTPRNALDSSSHSQVMLTPEARLGDFDDPFSTDVYFLGNLVRENFVQVSV